MDRAPLLLHCLDGLPVDGEVLLPHLRVVGGLGVAGLLGVVSGILEGQLASFFFGRAEPVAETGTAELGEVVSEKLRLDMPLEALVLL